MSFTHTVTHHLTGCFFAPSMFKYSAVSSPLDRSKHFTLHSMASRHVYSDTNSTALQSIQQQYILGEDYSFTFPPLSMARYSFIQLSGLGHRGENGNVQALKQQQRGFNLRLSRLSPAFYRCVTVLHARCGYDSSYFK